MPRTFFYFKKVKDFSLFVKEGEMYKKKKNAMSSNTERWLKDSGELFDFQRETSRARMKGHGLYPSVPREFSHVSLKDEGKKKGYKCQEINYLMYKGVYRFIQTQRIMHFVSSSCLYKDKRTIQW